MRGATVSTPGPPESLWGDGTREQIGVGSRNEFVRSQGRDASASKVYLPVQPTAASYRSEVVFLRHGGECGVLFDC